MLHHTGLYMLYFTVDNTLVYDYTLESSLDVKLKVCGYTGEQALISFSVHVCSLYDIIRIHT